jgi:hypothetical protein
MATKFKENTWHPLPKPKRRHKPRPYNHTKKLNKHSKWKR